MKKNKTLFGSLLRRAGVLKKEIKNEVNIYFVKWQ